MIRFAPLWACSLLVLACTGTGAPTAAPPPEPPPPAPTPSGPEREPLDGPAGEISGQPGLQAGPDGSVYLSWVEPTAGGHRLRFAVRPPEGGPWGEPRTLAEGADWFVNWADTPSLLVGPAGPSAIHWLARAGETTYAYHVMSAASADGGATWSAPRRLHADESESEHGFASLLPDAGGGARALWLDGGATLAGGPMSLRSRTIAPDGEVGPEAVVDDRTCDCCPTSAAALPGGGVIVAWRDRSEEEIRDIAIARYRAGAWEAPRIVTPDQWTMPGCPVNGPVIDSEGDHVALAWFTGEADQPRVQVALSHDGGETFPLRRVLSTSAVGRVDVVALADGGALVTWVEDRGEDAAAMLLMDVNGDAAPRLQAPIELGAVSPARLSGMPRVSLGGDGRLVLAWTDVSGDDPPTTRVRTATWGPIAR